MKRVLFAFACNAVFGNIVLLIVLAAGIMAVNTMQREVFPDFSMDEIMIEVPYPGASPQEVKEGVIREIEEVLESMEGIAQYASRSEEDLGSVEITVRHGYDAKGLLDRIRSRISAVSTFPAGAEKPMITEVMHRTEVMKLFLTADVSEQRLKEWARQIRDELRGLEAVSQIEIFGTREYEIHAEIPEAHLRACGLSLETVAGRIAESSLNISGGMIRTQTRDIRLRLPGQTYTARGLAEVAVLTRPDGSILTLGSLARINDGFTDASRLVTVNGEPAVVLEIYKTRREDALRISEAVTGYLTKTNRRLPGSMQINVLVDLTEDLRSRIDLLAKNGLMGLCLVLLLLWLFLDFRLGFWAGMGIPVSILGALVVVRAMGGTINMLSLFGLITVLGIVVDDAIVVGEAIFHHTQKGLAPPDAAMAGIEEVGMPVAASIATTILAFLPLAFIGDIIGKFLSILPMIVIPCLVISLLECLFLLPGHLAHGLKKKQVTKGMGTRPGGFFLGGIRQKIRTLFDDTAETIYLPLLKKALDYRYVSLCTAVCLLCLSLGLVAGGRVKIEVLPDTGSAMICASVKLKGGTSLDLTRQAVARLEAALVSAAQTFGPGSPPLLKNRLAVVGSTMGEDADDRERGPHMGSVQAMINIGDRPDMTADDLLAEWQQVTGTIPGAESVVFQVMAGGPPGEPVEIQLRGRNPVALKNAARDCMNELSKIKGLSQIRTDTHFGVDELGIFLKPEAGSLGITHKALAEQVRGAFYGREAVRLQRGRDDLRIKVRYTRQERSRLDTLETLHVETPGGHRLPLLSVAEIAVSKGPDVIRRVDGLDCLVVSAAVDETMANAGEIIDHLSEKFLPGLARTYPGMQVSFEGDEKHMRDALGGLFFGFPLALLGIYTVVAAMFRSYSQPFIVLSTVPFGIVGGIAGHCIMGYNVSLMSIFGLVALSGIVVNDAIMLVQKFNENMDRGMPFFKALPDAGRRRFRAIMLTTVSTVGGLAPLILETSLQARFLIPMALSISAGLIFATLLTPVLLPCMLAILSDLRLFWYRIFMGRPGKREHLEPVARRRFGKLKNFHSPAFTFQPGSVYPEPREKVTPQ